MGKYDLSIADYTEGIRIDPKNASFYKQRGMAYDETSEYDRAIADYTEAIRLDPTNADFFFWAVSQNKLDVLSWLADEQAAAINIHCRDDSERTT